MLVEYHNVFVMAAGANGNLYATPPSNANGNDAVVFATIDGVVIGDDQERYLHYYPDVMAAYNVSRLRLASEDATPKTSQNIDLVPTPLDPDDSSSPLVYVAVDTLDNAYNMVLCDFANGASSKIFIVNGRRGWTPSRSRS
ncbi:hypothetical protein MRB53_041724 [Persea americana]|nr:hypothetical protein MRB53_041724 [Persea americana]